MILSAGRFLAFPKPGGSDPNEDVCTEWGLGASLIERRMVDLAFCVAGAFASLPRLGVDVCAWGGRNAKACHVLGWRGKDAETRATSGGGAELSLIPL